MTTTLVSVVSVVHVVAQFAEHPHATTATVDHAVPAAARAVRRRR
jgi:Cu/Ag efflux protein CusF